MCLTSLHNIQQDFINFIPGFSSLLMQMIFFLLLKQTVPNFDTRYFCASVIYIHTNPMVMYELMRIRHMSTCFVEQASVGTESFQTALLLGKLFSHMVRVVNCCAGVLG